MASQPSGASSTNRARTSSVSRIRQGAPGVSCSPAMNPWPSQRCRVEESAPRIGGFSARARRREAHQGELALGPKTVTRHGDDPGRAWVARSGPARLHFGTPLTAKSGEGLRI